MQGKETRSHPFMLYWNCTRKFFSFHLSNLRAKRLWQLPIYFIFPCRVYFQSFLYFHNKSDLPILPDTSSEACIPFIQLFLWQRIYIKEWRQQKNSEKKDRNSSSLSVWAKTKRECKKKLFPGISIMQYIQKQHLKIFLQSLSQVRCKDTCMPQSNVTKINHTDVT